MATKAVINTELYNNLLSQKKLWTVVMKFHVSQNFIKNTKLAIMRPNKTKFSKNPNPLVGKLLKLTFKYEKAPNKNIAE